MTAELRAEVERLQQINTDLADQLHGDDGWIRAAADWEQRAKVAETTVARVEALCKALEEQCWMGHEYEQKHPDQTASLLIPVRDIRAALAGPEPETTEGGSGE